MPKLTSRIDLGHLLTIATMLVVAAVAYGRIDASLEFLKEKVAKLETLNDRVVRVETLVARPAR